MNRLPSRRQVLRMLAAGLPVALAGCPSSSDKTFQTTVSTHSSTTRLTPTGPSTQTATSVTDIPGTPQHDASGAITAAADETFDTFGTAVAIDGETALVGATDSSDGGAVLVFEKNGSWERTKILRPEKDSQEFGAAVAISGNIAVVGDRFANRGDLHNGLAYIFERGSEGWYQAATIGAPSGRGDDELFDGIGWSVAVASETVIVSAQREQSTMKSEVGSVQLFRRTDNEWKRTETLASQQRGFGWTVALLTPDRAAVGIPRVETSDGMGEVVIFDGTSDGWSETTRLSTSGDSQFGHTLAGDDMALAIGTRNVADDKNGASVYVYEQESGVWAQTRLDFNGTQSEVSPVAITDDTVVVGRPASDDQQGQAYSFERSSGEWSRQSELYVDGTTAAFGRTVAANDNIALVAAPRTTTDEQRGSVYVFTL